MLSRVSFKVNNNIKVDAVIFDKDGTLLEFDKFWVKVSQKAIESVLKNLQVNEDFENAILQAIGVNDGITDINGILCKGTYLQIAEEICKILNKNGYSFDLDIVEKEVISEYNKSQSIGEVVPTTPKLKELLMRLKSQNVRLAIVTTDNEYVTRKCLNKLGVDGIFDKIYTDDGKTPVKPNPYCVFDFCKAFNLEKENVLMVGDTLTDVEFAKNAGIKVVGVAKHTQNRKILQGQADIVIDDLSSILQIIN